MKANVLDNKFYKKATQSAKALLKDPVKLNQVLSAAKEKMTGIQFDNEKVGAFVNKVKVLIRMVKAYVKGEYKSVPWKTLLAILAGIVYFVMPLDLVPDFIPITGFLDDFTVIMLITNAFQSDIENYRLWEKNNVG